MQSWSRISRKYKLPRLAAFAVLTAAPAVVLAHTGADGGEHHNFLDELAHGVSDIDSTAALLALGAGILVLVIHQWMKRSSAARERKRQAQADRKL